MSRRMQILMLLVAGFISLALDALFITPHGVTGFLAAVVTAGLLAVAYERAVDLFTCQKQRGTEDLMKKTLMDQLVEATARIGELITANKKLELDSIRAGLLKNEVASLNIDKARLEGYIDRVREMDGVAPSATVAQYGQHNAIAELQSHIANGPENRANQILDILDKDQALLNAVTGKA